MLNQDVKRFVERIETLMEEADAVRDSIKNVYTEAAEHGLDKAALRRVIADRRKNQSALAELERKVDAYKAALGMLADTPLGQAGEPK
ncbi:MAG: GapR family DNA-binding domain-containing protein [Verrucomicrobiota bacterium]